MNIKNNIVKRIISITLVIVMMSFSSSNLICCYASGIKANRYETVYVSLDNYGNINEATMYVDTTLNGQNDIIDNGKFKSVENMTDKTQPEYDEQGNLVWHLNNKKDSFAYNTILDESTYKNVPWNFDFTYELNGKVTQPEKLAHEKGVIKITINVKPNVDADSYYRNNYMMEITSDFDMNNYISVTSDEAIEVVNGKTKTLMWVVLPGAESEIKLFLGTEDFKYDGLTFAIVPIDGKISDKIVELINDKNDIEGAYRSSMKSTDIVLNSLANMTAGFDKVADGIANAKAGTIKLHELKGKRDMTVDELEKELSQLIDNLTYLENNIDDSRDKVSELFDIISDLKNETENLEKSTKKLEKDFDKLERPASRIEDNVENAKELISVFNIIVEDSKKLLDILTQSATADATELQTAMLNLKTDLQTAIGTCQATGEISAVPSLMSAATELQNIANQLESLSTLSTSEIKTLMNLSKSLSKISEKLYDTYNDLDDLRDDAPIFEDAISDTESLLDDLSQTIKVLNNSSKKILENEKDIDGYLKDLGSLVKTLEDISKIVSNEIPNIKKALDIVSTDLYKGAISSMDGLGTVTSSLKQATSQTAVFLDAKEKLDKIISDNWNDINEKSTIFEMNPNAKKVSFSSNLNDEPEKVQIFLKSPEIKEVVDDDLAKLQNDKQKVGIWNRIIQLFVKVWNSFMSLFKSNNVEEKVALIPYTKEVIETSMRL